MKKLIYASIAVFVCATAPVAYAQENSVVFDLGGAVKALTVGSEYLDGASWRPKSSGNTELQRELLRQYPIVRNSLSRIPEFTGFASRSASEINRAIAARGFNIRLNEFDGIGMVSFLDARVAWQESGRTSTLTISQTRYPAFVLKRRVGVRFSALLDSTEPVVQVTTTSGDIVSMLRSDIRPADWRTVYRIARNIQTASGDYSDQYDGVVVPMINLSTQPDISWIAGIFAGNDTINQAKQEVRFRMNQIGARAESVTAMATTRGRRPVEYHYEIDGPFYLVISRPGVDTPIFAAYLSTEVFTDPGTLE